MPSTEHPSSTTTPQPREPSCTEALRAAGYGHGDNREANRYRRPIYSLATGEVVASMSADDAWRWLASGCPIGADGLADCSQERSS